MIASGARSFWRGIDGWSTSVAICALVLLAPLIAVFFGLFEPSAYWGHLAGTVLPGYIANTLIVVLGVGILSVAIAVPTAWLVASFDFTGRRFWEWALIMPLAVPTFTSAFVYYDVLNFSIPLIVKVRELFGFDASQWTERVIRYGTLIILLTSVLYPYLFTCLRVAFSREQSVYFEAGRVLGQSNGSIFRRVALPLARPALVAGLSLIVMEVVNDYGAVNFFGVPTLTEGIFRSWFGLGDRVAGIRLAAVVICLVFFILALERWQRRRKRFAPALSNTYTHERLALSRKRAILANVLCAVPFIIGFIYPVAKLTHWAIIASTDFNFLRFLKQVSTSLSLAVGISILIALLAFFLAYCTRLHGGLFRRYTDSATIGYAIPSVVTGVGVMTLLGALDNSPLASIWSFTLSGSVAAISFAYTVRFLTVAYMPALSGIERTCGSLQEVSQSLGQSRWRSMTKIYWPLLRGNLLAGGTLVFIDLTKELPLTLILRPSGFETLATHAFGFAKEGLIYDSAFPSLMIILLGVWGLRIIHRYTEI
ncbi:MAG: iron ABC transporter permease [Verrucomicrobiota bacterium]